MIIIWIVLYFAVGWVITEMYNLGGGIWGPLVFIGWPILIASLCVITTLLLLFGLAFVIDEIYYKLFCCRKDES